MTEEFIFKGETVDLAIENALKELNVSREGVEIEIIEQGKKKLLGLGNKQAKVMVIEKEDHPSPKEGIPSWESWLKNHDEQIEEINEPSDVFTHTKVDLNGKAWVKDAQIYCQDTPDKKPIVQVPKGATLYKNGEKVHLQTYITSKDELYIDLETTRVETKWAVKINANKEVVQLHVEPGYYIIRQLVDQPPQESLILEIEEKRQANNELIAKDIFDELEKMGVSIGIQEEEITKACRTSEPRIYTIALGIPPKHGMDGTVEFSIDIEEKTKLFTEEIDGTIDFRDSVYIPSIDRGQVLGVIEPPTEGEDGMNVLGEIIQAKDGQPIIVNPGKGVVFLEEDNKILAMEFGRPKVETTGQLVRVSIMPKLVHRGDLSIENGNIDFVGDVEIFGSVNEQMIIDADGSIYIHNSAIQSTVLAKSSVFIHKHSIGSQITAGKNNLILTELGDKLKPFLATFYPLINAISQLSKNPSFQAKYTENNGIVPLMKVLIDQKFPTLNKHAVQLLDVINEQQDTLEKRWKHFANTLYKGIVVLHKESFLKLDDLMKFYEEGQELYDFCRTPVEPNSKVSLSYGLNSNIYSSGDIHIFGKGVWHSEVYSEASVQINGALVGGEVYGEKEVYVNTAGSPTGVKTMIKVPATGVIKIDLAHEDTMIQVGNRKHIFKKDESKVVARLDENEFLLLH
ncbi:FapA family protein [Bacillus shivajii]|uniref:flagellar assembly protein A n=1 Tax=Bacillus shivajii TaxID=1983719 RepID=UPI001CFC1A8F|nr:flagellar assembly protein A [Bacillus shivajii]UCZ53645.1 FapA family protein [Bacillus shivajii]